MYHPEHRSFGCVHYRDRGQPHHSKVIQKYPISSLAQPSHNNTPCTGNVFYDTLICTAAHSAEVDQNLRKTILASTKSEKALKAVESVIFQNPLITALVGTTRAVDIVGGGVKS